MTTGIPMSHQQIADSRGALEEEERRAKQRVHDDYAARYQDLRQACGAIGHIMSGSILVSMMNDRRCCAVCGTPEPVKPAGVQ